MPIKTDRPTLYAMLLAEGCALDHYNTDLYVLDSPQAREVMALYEGDGGLTNKQRFRSEIDHKTWWDLPFHYVPRTVRDIAPATFEDGRHAALRDIEEVSEGCWVGTSRTEQEIAIRINEEVIEVCVAHLDGSREDAVRGFEGSPCAELYGVRAGALLDRADGRTMERVLDLAGITRAAPGQTTAPKMG